MKLEVKIEALETRLRRQRIGMIALGLGLAGAVALGMNQEAPTTLTLEGLTITSQGNPRIVFGTNEEDGGVGISFLDSKGIARVAMGTDIKGDGGVVVLDEKQTPRVIMGSGPQGSGIVVFGGGVIELPMPAEPAKP